MIGHEASKSRSRGRSWQIYLSITAALIAAGCRPPDAPASASPAVLRIGFGLGAGQSETLGLRQVINSLTSEGLLSLLPNGRVEPSLAQSWSQSDDGRTLKIQLRPNATFHNGQPVDATTIAAVLSRRLPGSLGLAASDIETISAISPAEVEIALKNRSNFVLEGLELTIVSPDATRAATGPFSPAPGNGPPVLLRNDSYYGGKAAIERIEIRPYNSVRAAWADSLRGDVDMLYEVGMDAISSLEGSTQTKVFNIRRPYSYMVVLNPHTPALKSAEVRRRLNAAIDRQRLVQEILGGHGTPAFSPVWPFHWAHDETVEKFAYQPQMLAPDTKRLQFTCLLAEGSLERLALAIQNQLSAVGVDMKVELVSLDEFGARTTAGNFEAVLGDIVAGPTMLRPSLFWYTGAMYNWGRYSSPAVDAALNAMNRADSDAVYKAGFADFQRALVEDPPAIFISWTERARAVSTRFDVPFEPGREILRGLRLWRPLAPAKTMSLN